MADANRPLMSCFPANAFRGCVRAVIGEQPLTVRQVADAGSTTHLTGILARWKRRFRMPLTCSYRSYNERLDCDPS